ncbi:flagellar basal body rod protein FlgB [Paraconexibacter antarcticus]|uniref:Flagellar basal body rod protein FlgB n=1 Tax=Paraconexibacter antarcticus TaxID=2949664 RepID=A0ABY5DRJ8_9ACTN|nr:flagellar basal body rod protein FlgB [Paraconexibacter antarcticus]UTI64656.1 flagellar basal body rod protein FlgB [Paraconexibacter antarcticus]
MDLFDPTQLGLAAALRGSAAQQTAIAQNLANANTPGYRRVSVDFQSQLQSLMAAGDRKGLQAFTPQMTVDNAAPVRADGSTVDVEKEAAAQASNGMTYQAIAQVMAARIDIIGSALGVK